MTTPTDTPELPPEPDRPDCCNGGCAVCVLDGYAEEMHAWRRACAAILDAHRQARRAAPDAAA